MTIEEQQQEIIDTAIRLGEEKALGRIMEFIHNYRKDTDDKDNE